MPLVLLQAPDSAVLRWMGRVELKDGVGTTSFGDGNVLCRVVLWMCGCRWMLVLLTMQVWQREVTRDNWRYRGC